MEKVLVKIKPTEKEMAKMKRGTENLVKELEKRIKKKRMKAEVFVGGSSGKNTVVKRKKQDIDIFARFSGEYKDKEISNLLEKTLLGLRKRKIRGSRDYFKVRYKGLSFEVVPVLKINKPEQAKNITDLSYFHVSYVNRKIKELKIKDDIILAKSFCYAQDCYGAESYISGFSGYAAELLVIYYKSFLNMVKRIAKLKLTDKEKLIIDLEKHYKNKQEVMLEMNEAKLVSPIIFVDPTYKQRNALSSLSYETFFRFQKACRKFLKKPSEKFFEKQKINRKKFNLILKAKTRKQEGDIAGSKLYKFFKLVASELEKYFLILDKEFEYEEGKTASLYFKIKQRKFLILEGPPVTALENVSAFKKKHKRVFIKGGKVYAREKSKSVKKFLSEFEKENKKRMRDMDIVNLKVS